MKKLLLLLLLTPAIVYAAVTFPINGGTGTSTKPTVGQVLVGLSNGTYSPVATSTLGLTGWVFSSSTIWQLFSNTATGLTYNNGTGATSLTAGYNIPLTASTTQWDNFYNASSTYVPYTGASSNVDLGLFSATGTDFTAKTSFLPDTNGGASLGVAFYGFSSLFLRDGATAYTLGLQASNTGAAGSQTLTFDVGNYSPTLIFSGGAGNPTLGDWFDQSVKTTASPTFAGVKSTTFVNASTTLGVTGRADLYSTLNVTGKTTLANASSTSHTVSGLSYLATTTVTGDVTVSGNIPNRVVGYTASSTITINVDTTDEATTTVNQTTTFANPTGTPRDGFMYLMTLTATTTQTVSWGTNFASSTDLTAPLSIASGTTEVLWKYDGFKVKYLLLGVLKTFE